MGEAEAAEILASVARLARERFSFTDEITFETRLVEDLGLDSLKALEMLVEIENQFRIRIDEDSEGEIVTVGDLIRVVLESRDGSGGDA